MNKIVSKEYQNITEALRPRSTAIKVMKLFKGETGQLIDLGCGKGADTLFFISRGWKVLSIDQEIDDILKVKEELSNKEKSLLDIRQCKFEKIKLPKAKLINASFSIPFCNPAYFDELWQEVKNKIILNGRFSGTLFGNRDEWKNDSKDKIFHTKEEARRLFKGFEIEFFNEKEYEGYCIGKENKNLEKHWHYYEIIAKKLEDV